MQCGISIIPFFEFLVLSRFFLGVLNAFYVSVASSYIKENFPFNLRKKMGAVYSAGRILGILICYLISELFNYTEDETEHIIVFFGPAFLALIQAILIRIYLPESIVDLLKLQRYDQLRASVGLLYSQEIVSLRIQQIKD
jgi:MFS family permease